MRGIIGVVESEDDGEGRFRVTRTAMVNEGPCETTEGFAVSLIFQPGEGRRPSEVLLDVQGGLHYAEFAHAVTVEAMGVIPICGLFKTMPTALDKAGLLGQV